ncbi:MAG: hypothetical protein KF832_14705 [Caldilineaceae bacterium]|nr:hypothetical protein [Caldilineaceae bacterium]
MKRLLVLILLCFVGIAAWRISERLSADAIGMALGVLFGVLAGVPVALLVLASARRRERWQDEEPGPARRRGEPDGRAYAMPVQQPPVIVLAGPGYPAQMAQGGGQPAQSRLLPPPQANGYEVPQERRFKVIGEKEEWIDEW